MRESRIPPPARSVVYGDTKSSSVPVLTRIGSAMLNLMELRLNVRPETSVSQVKNITGHGTVRVLRTATQRTIEVYPLEGEEPPRKDVEKGREEKRPYEEVRTIPPTGITVQGSEAGRKEPEYNASGERLFAFNLSEDFCLRADMDKVFSHVEQKRDEFNGPLDGRKAPGIALPVAKSRVNDNTFPVTYDEATRTKLVAYIKDRAACVSHAPYNPDLPGFVGRVNPGLMLVNFGYLNPDNHKHATWEAYTNSGIQFFVHTNVRDSEGASSPWCGDGITAVGTLKFWVSMSKDYEWSKINGILVEVPAQTLLQTTMLPDDYSIANAAWCLLDVQRTGQRALVQALYPVEYDTENLVTGGLYFSGLYELIFRPTFSVGPDGGVELSGATHIVNSRITSNTNEARIIDPSEVYAADGTTWDAVASLFALKETGNTVVNGRAYRSRMVYESICLPLAPSDLDVGGTAGELNPWAFNGLFANDLPLLQGAVYENIRSLVYNYYNYLPYIQTDFGMIGGLLLWGRNGPLEERHPTITQVIGAYYSADGGYHTWELEAYSVSNLTYNTTFTLDRTEGLSTLEFVSVPEYDYDNGGQYIPIHTQPLTWTIEGDGLGVQAVSTVNASRTVFVTLRSSEAEEVPAGEPKQEYSFQFTETSSRVSTITESPEPEAPEDPPASTGVYLYEPELAPDEDPPQYGVDDEEQGNGTIVLPAGMLMRATGYGSTMYPEQGDSLDMTDIRMRANIDHSFSRSIDLSELSVVGTPTVGTDGGSGSLFQSRNVAMDAGQLDAPSPAINFTGLPWQLSHIRAPSFGFTVKSVVSTGGAVQLALIDSNQTTVYVSPVLLPDGTELGGIKELGEQEGLNIARNPITGQVVSNGYNPQAWTGLWELREETPAVRTKQLWQGETMLVSEHYYAIDLPLWDG